MSPLLKVEEQWSILQTLKQTCSIILVKIKKQSFSLNHQGIITLLLKSHPTNKFLMSPEWKMPSSYRREAPPQFWGCWSEIWKLCGDTFNKSEVSEFFKYHTVKAWLLRGHRLTPKMPSHLKLLPWQQCNGGFVPDAFIKRITIISPLLSTGLAQAGLLMDFAE